MDKSILNKWVIHGKRHESMVQIASKEVTARSLISTSPGKSNKVISINNQGSTSATPNTVIETTTEEVVNTVNKYRKNLLNESEPQSPSTVSLPKTDYTSPENVVKIIEEYREEIFMEHEPAPIKEGILIDLSEKEVTPRSRMDETMLDYKEKGKLSDERVKKFKKPINKTVLPVELHEFAKVNADCTNRLQKEAGRPYTLSNNNPFLVEEDKSHSSSSSDNDDCIKDVKKRIKKKQGARSSDSEEDLTLDSSSEVK
ncbi:hypothetical protein RhiirA5_436707, partial [Rhizophagus irregularis]